MTNPRRTGLTSVADRSTRRRRGRGSILAPAGTARRAALGGAVAGLAGVAVMTLGEQAEQALTHRPDSFVPARTLQRLLGRDHPVDSWGWNHAMHWGTGVVVGAVRGLAAHAGLRGPGVSAGFTGVRLAFDQTLENATGVGSPPWTWSRDELAVDVLHKAVYSVATGLVADRLVPRRSPGSSRGVSGR